MYTNASQHDIWRFQRATKAGMLGNEYAILYQVMEQYKVGDYSGVRKISGVVAMMVKRGIAIEDAFDLIYDTFPELGRARRMPEDKR